jgi:hypothetical protein
VDVDEHGGSGWQVSGAGWKSACKNLNFTIAAIWTPLWCVRKSRQTS